MKGIFVAKYLVVKRLNSYLNIENTEMDLGKEGSEETR